MKQNINKILNITNTQYRQWRKMILKFEIDAKKFAKEETKRSGCSQNYFAGEASAYNLALALFKDILKI